MEADDLLEILYVAANARTPEEKARVAWRASDYMWWQYPRWPAGFCRRFNDICPSKPWIDDLWEENERAKFMGELYNAIRTLQAQAGKPASQADGS